MDTVPSTTDGMQGLGYMLSSTVNGVRMAHLVLPLFFILIYEPPLSIVAVGHLVGADELDMAKVLGPLGDDACQMLGLLQVHLGQDHGGQDSSI